MTSTGIPLFAGIASTVIFAASVVPMVVKAWRTRDLRSYSRGYLVLAAPPLVGVRPRSNIRPLPHGDVGAGRRGLPSAA